MVQKLKKLQSHAWSPCGIYPSSLSALTNPYQISIHFTSLLHYTIYTPLKPLQMHHSAFKTASKSSHGNDQNLSQEPNSSSQACARHVTKNSLPTPEPTWESSSAKRRKGRALCGAHHGRWVRQEVRHCIEISKPSGVPEIAGAGGGGVRFQSRRCSRRSLQGERA